MSDVVTFEELMNSRPFDVHKWSDYPEVNLFVDEIYSLLSMSSSNVRIAKKNLKVVLLDLYVVWLTDPKLKIMVSRNNNDYKARSRYNEIHIGKTVLQVIDCLENLDLISVKNGIYDHDQKSGYVSRIWPTQKLLERFKKAKFSQFMIGSHEDRETVILRDEDGKDIDYPDTPETIRMRKVLHDYNVLLADTHIDIVNLEGPLIVLGQNKNYHRIQINQQDKYVHRVFNKGSWVKGGRFYGGWWQRCPKEHRPYIYMDDIQTAEIDFSGLHIIILYAKERIDYWADVGVDPYDLGEIDGIDPEIDLRSLAKRLLLIAINAESAATTFAAFRRHAEAGSIEKSLKNVILQKILDALKEKHKPIASKLASGAGIDLMYVDSRITEILVQKFTYDYKCPILCIHDSYIVPFGYDRVLHREMQSAFTAVTGVKNPRLKHTTDYYDILQEELGPDEEPDEVELAKHTPSERHTREWASFREFKGKQGGVAWWPKNTMIY